MAISNIDSNILWARAGGMCSNPSCRIDLTITLEKKKYHIGEMAHIIAKSPDGPRGISGIINDTYDNLILLCPTCHTKIDKSPVENYSIEKLCIWKNKIEKLIRNKIYQPNHPYRLFECLNDIFCFQYGINYINNHEWLCSKDSIDSTYNMLERARNNLFYLHGRNEDIFTQIENILEKFYQDSISYSELCQLSKKLVAQMDFNFRSERDIKCVNVARYYAQVIKNSALEQDSSISIQNFKSSLFSLLLKHDDIIDSILKESRSKNFESELHQRIGYLLHTLN